MKGTVELTSDEIVVGQQESQLTDRLIAVNRVAKVVKGGRRFGFNALVAVGDGKGQVGLAMGKANDVSEAIRKGIDKARKNMSGVTLRNNTLPHEIVGKFGAARIFLKPAAPGTGIIAGGAARAVLEVAGVHNVLTKCIGTTTAHNVAKATLQALKQCKNLQQIRQLRQISV
ncbi:MAG: 30S ribosomal protein S5 [Chitinivibrionales bacterium]|nr:30S ribosomal protein S5 [Chitinivibrionales bacterium]